MKRRDLIAAAAGALATTALAGSIAWAAIPADGGVYVGCVRKDNGAIRLIDKSLPPTNSMSKCKSIELEISWNQQGPQGNPGEPGAVGAPGTAGPPGEKGDKGDTGDPGPAGADGAPGPEGDKGDPCLSSDPSCVGPQGPPGSVESSYRGQWSARQYAHGDIVTHNGSLWIGVLNPPALEEPGNSQLWDLLAAKGANGTPGQAGPQGPKGDKGDTGATGAQGPAGPAGVSGYEISGPWGRTYGPFEGFTLAADCPAGKRVLGGGYRGERTFVDKDYPKDADSWEVAGSTGASGGSIFAYAICAIVS